MKLSCGHEPRRKAIILVSCCLSLLIVSMDATIVNVAIPNIRADLGASASQLQWVIDIYTLVLASLLLLAGAAGRPVRPQAHVPDRPDGVRLRLAAVQPRAEHRDADRRAVPAGHRRLDDESGGDVDHHAGVHRPRGARPRDRRLGRRRRHLDGAGSDRRRCAHRVRRLAGGVLDQPADLCARDPAHRDLRARVQVGDDARRRPDRTGPRHGCSCSASFTCSSKVPAWAGPTSASSPSPWSRCSRFVGVPALRGAASRPVHRSAVLPQHPVRVGDGDRGVRVRRVGRLPVHDVAVPAGRARLLGDAHRADLSAGSPWRAGLLAAVRSAGRSVRRPAVAADRRRPDHRGDVDADLADRDDAGVAAARRSSRCSASASRWSTRRSPTPR